MVKILKMIILPIVFLLIIAPAFSHPIQPCTFWGEVYVGDEIAPIGTEILAYNSNGKICGTYTIGQKQNDNAGYYGFLGCVGKYNEEYPVAFTINGLSAKVTGNVIWESGATKKVNLEISQKTIASTSDKTYNYVETGDEVFFEIVGEQGEVPVVRKQTSFYQRYSMLLLALGLVLLVILFVVIKKRRKRNYGYW